MLEKFIKNISEKNLCNKSQSILLAVSGGVDSVVMTQLFLKAGYKIALAHCNFGLRGKESLDDEKFVENLAAKYKLNFFIKRFRTKAFAQKHKLSIQEAARTLRYEWFEHIRNKNNYDFIATAHHADDQIETFFINLFRTTGIKGLSGIPEKQQFVIRPMLCFSREEIETYAEKNAILFRKDSSNDEDKYLRNKIRHDLIPVIRNIQPQYLQNITETIRNLKNTEILYRDFLQKYITLKQQGGRLYIPIEQIINSPAPEHLLYEYIHQFGFNTADCINIIRSAKGISGKVFYSETHRLIKDRKEFIIEQYNKAPVKSYFIDKNIRKITVPLKMQFKTLKKTSQNEIFTKDPDVAFLDKDKLKFPLELRKWKKGDMFYPLGMKGKKKLSDFFTDKKLSIADKENLWLLCSEGNIVWIVGHRIDNRFKITAGTKNILMVKKT